MLLLVFSRGEVDVTFISHVVRILMKHGSVSIIWDKISYVVEKKL